MKDKIISVLLCVGIIFCIVLLFIAKQNQWILVVGIVACGVVLTPKIMAERKRAAAQAKANEVRKEKEKLDQQVAEMLGSRKEKMREQVIVKTVEKRETGGSHSAQADRAPKPQTEAAGKRAERQRTFDLRLENSLKKKVTLAGTAVVKARQGYLRKISEWIEPFDMCHYGINQTEYKGAPAFQVCAQWFDRDDKVLGMVPAADVQDVLKIVDRIFHVDVDVYGGPEYEGDDKYYGASATFYYEKE